MTAVIARSEVAKQPKGDVEHDAYLGGFAPLAKTAIFTAPARRRRSARR